MVLINGIYFLEVLILYNCIFVRIVLNFYLSHILGNFNAYWGYDLQELSTLVCIVNFFIVWLFMLIATYYDLKFGIIPNELSLILIFYGLAFNVLLSFLLNSPYILLFSMLLTVSITLISFLLWHIGFWGGGDFKLFIGLSLSLSFLDLNYLNPMKISSVDHYLLDLNLPIMNQFLFYPKVFSILLNGILVAFIFLSLVLIYNMAKNGKLRYYSILSLLDFKSFFNQLNTKSIHIGDLSEGMVLDKYYFNDMKVFSMIGSYKNDDKYNLCVCDEMNDFYFSSLNAMGLTGCDISLIKDLYRKDLIKNPYFQIKKAIPFVPFLTMGYIAFLLFGDFISIVSSFIKLLF